MYIAQGEGPFKRNVAEKIYKSAIPVFILTQLLAMKLTALILGIATLLATANAVDPNEDISSKRPAMKYCMTIVSPDECNNRPTCVYSKSKS